MATFPACRLLSVVHVLMTCTRHQEGITSNTRTEQRSGKQWSPEEYLWKAICHFKDFASMDFGGLQTCWVVKKAHCYCTGPELRFQHPCRVVHKHLWLQLPGSSSLHINPHSVLCSYQSPVHTTDRQHLEKKECTFDRRLTGFWVHVWGNETWLRSLKTAGNG